MRALILPAILIAFVTSMCGCATHRPMTAFKPEACPSDKALIYIFCEHGWKENGRPLWMNPGVSIYVNDVPQARLWKHEYFPLITNPGAVVFGYGVPGNPPIPFYYYEPVWKNTAHISAQAGETYYIEYYRGFNEVSPVIAESVITNCVRGKPEN